MKLRDECLAIDINKAITDKINEKTFALAEVWGEWEVWNGWEVVDDNSIHFRLQGLSQTLGCPIHVNDSILRPQHLLVDLNASLLFSPWKPTHHPSYQVRRTWGLQRTNRMLSEVLLKTLYCRLRWSERQQDIWLLAAMHLQLSELAQLQVCVVIVRGEAV